MRQRTILGALLAGLLLSGCQDELLDPLGGAGEGASGGGGATSGGGGTGGEGGEGGAPLPADRGDPATFPTECLATCEEACNAIVACGSETSSAYPLGMEDCLARCAVAADGPFWDDVSGVFRCCASQSECGAAAHCGGWLAHPATPAPCEVLCACFTSSSLSTLTAGRAAPAGYNFAPDAVFLAPGADAIAARRVPGVVRVDAGPYTLVTLGAGEQPTTLAQLQQAGAPLPTFSDRGGRLSAATGRIVLRARSTAELGAASKTLARFQLLAPKKLGFAADLYVVESADAWRSLDAVAALTRDGADAELDMVRSYAHSFLPNDPLYEDQWHLHNSAQGLSTAGVDARLQEAWDVTRGSSSVVIAVNDDGVDLNHFDFAGKLLAEQNYPADWQEQMESGQFGWHGTSCAGVATARGNNLFAGSGACSECELLPRLLAPTVNGGFQLTDTEMADGFVEQVDAGAWVISNSWGPSTGHPVYADEDMPVPGIPSVVAAAFDYAETSGRGGLGTVIVFAAGNSNATIDGVGGYPTNLSVGAVSDLGIKSYYSSFGPELDISAPSNGGLTGITTAAFNGGTTNDFGGTSSACPLVAGVVGLVFSANPLLTAAEARGVVTATAHKIDPLFGDYDVNGVSPFYGHGMVDAARAVRLAAGLCADASSCHAPSDECGAQCGTQDLCDPCRTSADCVPGSICQALPSLGMTTCLPLASAGCPAGSNAVGAYCVPDAATCGLCAPFETCNGRDDDCDGLSDEDDVCGGAARCFDPTPGCAEGQVCAGTVCVDTCVNNAACPEGEECRKVKDGYGADSGLRTCVTSGASGCELGCEVIASTLDDAPLADFTACMDEAGDDCNSVFGCTNLLPISM